MLARTLGPTQRERYQQKQDHRIHPRSPRPYRGPEAPPSRPCGHSARTLVLWRKGRWKERQGQHRGPQSPPSHIQPRGAPLRPRANDGARTPGPTRKGRWRKRGESRSPLWVTAPPGAQDRVAWMRSPISTPSTRCRGSVRSQSTQLQTTAWTYRDRSRFLGGPQQRPRTLQHPATPQGGVHSEKRARQWLWQRARGERFAPCPFSLRQQGILRPGPLPKDPPNRQLCRRGFHP
mmetsp:Transcript_99006/g.279714  ORF Transcript_99006/g.279714 Transcript_99006/m.279714 type:complete len:234 (+) Transcript_99006:184-885(+)